MNVLVYGKKTFEYKEHLYLSNDYQIVLDTVINQSSYFVTNSIEPNVSVGDILIVHERSFFYIGTVTTIEIMENSQTKVTSIDFLSSLDFGTVIENFHGNVGGELLRYIKEELIENTDSLQNKRYLKLLNESTMNGSIVGEDDKVTQFTEIYSNIYNEYKVRLSARLGIVNGVITHIKIIAKDFASEFVLSSNFPMIRNLIITDSKEPTVNKITFIPSINNVSALSTRVFYLLSDNTISMENNLTLRIADVVEKKHIYKDDEENELSNLASVELLKEEYKHNITFNIIKGNSVFVPLDNIQLGDKVLFIHGTKRWATILTRLEMSGSMEDFLVTLGEQRIKLTEKLKLLLEGK